MREILFRGKTVCNGDWVYGGITWNPSRKKVFIHTKWDECEVIPETVGQYTGVTDKNGKKIFEGDICKTCICKSDMSEEDVVGMIYFRDGAFEFGFEYGDIYVSDILDASEVIGNIHDNPELIKE